MLLIEAIHNKQQDAAKLKMEAVAINYGLPGHVVVCIHSQQKEGGHLPSPRLQSCIGCVLLDGPYVVLALPELKWAEPLRQPLGLYS